MNYTALWQTLALCIISVLFEAAGTTKSGKAWFESLRKPAYSLPFAVWYVVGGLYYIMCGVISYRLLAMYGMDLQRLSPLLLMMFTNGIGNFLLFRFRSLWGFYFSLFPFTVILLFLFIQLLQIDKISAFVLLPYVIWLIYDFYYLHSLWKINKDTGSRENL